MANYQTNYLGVWVMKLEWVPEAIPAVAKPSHFQLERSGMCLCMG